MNNAPLLAIPAKALPICRKTLMPIIRNWRNLTIYTSLGNVAVGDRSDFYSMYPRTGNSLVQMTVVGEFPDVWYGKHGIRSIHPVRIPFKEGQRWGLFGNSPFCWASRQTIGRRSVVYTAWKCMSHRRMREWHVATFARSTYLIGNRSYGGRLSRTREIRTIESFTTWGCGSVAKRFLLILRPTISRGKRNQRWGNTRGFAFTAFQRDTKYLSHTRTLTVHGT